MNATISADVIASSSLSGMEIEGLTERIYWLFEKINEVQLLRKKESAFCRLVAGDSIECLINDPRDSLRIMLILKNGIKSFLLENEIKETVNTKRRKLFRTYGIRLAIGIGDMNIDLLEKNILNGEAINRSGRLIAEQKTSDKEKATIKNTLFFDSPQAETTTLFVVIMGLLDELHNRITQKQSEILLWKLLRYNEAEIAVELGIAQSSVNQQSRAAGWNAVEQAVLFCESYDFQNNEK